MSEQAIKAGKKVDGEKKEATVYHDLGDNLQEMIDKYGEDTVFTLAQREASRKLKAAIRRELKAGTDPEAVPDRLADWRPDVKHTVQQDPEQAAEQAFSAMSKEKQEEYLRKMREKVQNQE